MSGRRWARSRSRYRGGYLPRERREIERKLREGDIRAVVSTNALELGIDIGSLDAVVMAGYPGTIASSLQRAGRAGAVYDVIAVLVASSAPLDQYIVEHPEYFFERSPEHAHINPDNLEIALNHLRCAAFELPIREGESFGPHDVGRALPIPRRVDSCIESGGAWHWTSDTYPADAVSLRAVSSDNFVVIDITGDHKVIAEVSFPTALTTLHEKAIYLHDARQYQVERFDYDGRKAYVRRVDSDYFTDAIDYTQVKILDSFETRRRERGGNPARRRSREHGRWSGSRKSDSIPWRMSAPGISRCRSRKCTPPRFGCIFRRRFSSNFPIYTRLRGRAALRPWAMRFVPSALCC